MRRAVEASSRCLRLGSPGARLWIAAGLVAALPAIALWSLDVLTPQRTAPAAELHSETIARSFGRDEAVTSRTGAPRLGGEAFVVNDVSRGALPARAAAPALHSSNLTMTPPAAAVSLAAVKVPSMLPWQLPEVLGALAIYLAFSGIAVALILSVARGLKSSPLLPPVIALEGTGVRPADRLAADLRRLAEQVRLDVADTVHDMRSSIAVFSGSIDTLRRTVPRDDARASRAIQRANIAAQRLVTMMDEAWHTGNALATLFVAPRQRVALGRILVDVSGDRMRSFRLKLLCPPTTECPVAAPEGVLELAIDRLFQTLRDILPAGAVLSCSASDSSDKVCLEICTSAAGALEWEIDRLVPPDTALTVALLGGSLEAITTASDVRTLRIVLPRHG